MASRLKPFVKGYEFDEVKIGTAFDFDGLKDPTKAQRIIDRISEQLSNDAFLGLAVAYKHGSTDRAVSILVLDDDFDEPSLKDRPLKPLHPDVLRYMEVFTGPDVWRGY
jgi:hypothetical protein